MECTIHELNVKEMSSIMRVFIIREEAVQAWVFNAPRWKRSDESSAVAKPKFELAVDS